MLYVLLKRLAAIIIKGFAGNANATAFCYWILKRKQRGTEIGNLKFRSTWDIIDALERGLLPEKIMFTFHPQRWTDGALPWVKELVWQRVKNVGKGVLVKFRGYWEG